MRDDEQREGGAPLVPGEGVVRHGGWWARAVGGATAAGVRRGDASAPLFGRPPAPMRPSSALDRALGWVAAPRPTLAKAAPRALWVCAAAVAAVWVAGPLGGVGRVTPTPAGDTSTLFNYHPLFMVAAVGLWTEAALQFTAPAAGPGGKPMHALLHATATVTAITGITCAWLSHLLHKPPIPSLYTAHALLGATTLTAVLAQAAIGALSFLYPGGGPAARAAIAPAHRALGKTALALAAATAAAGFQEKAAVLLVERDLAPRSAAVALPAGGALLLVASVAAALLKLHAGGRVGGGPPPGSRPVPTNVH